MRIESGIMLLAAATVFAQSAPPVWKEFSVGPNTANRTRFGPEGMRAEGVPVPASSGARVRSAGTQDHRPRMD